MIVKIFAAFGHDIKKDGVKYATNSKKLRKREETKVCISEERQLGEDMSPACLPVPLMS